MRGLNFLAFVALTVVCWGIYGPVLHEGQILMGGDGQKSSLRPFICVGLAYFLIAVLFPVFVLYSKGEKGTWSLAGFVWSFLAGAIGAFGALGIILAFKFQGRPTYVMPLVFGLAPVVNTFCTMFFSRTFKEASALFYVGVVVVAIGAAGVLTFKPSDRGGHGTGSSPAALPSPTATEHDAPNDKDSGDQVSGHQNSGDRDAGEKDAGDSGKTGDLTDSPERKIRPMPVARPNYPMIVASIALTALCWGAYGPVLHRGQMKMGQSRLRPFLCVGLAYFAIAVVATYLLLPTFPEPGGWTLAGVFWSLLGGAGGAFGALGIIYAFNFGGKPIFVMPLVFGLAPVVNTFTEMLTKGLMDDISLHFYLSLVVTILGAVMVLVCAPRAHPPATKSQPESAQP